MADELPKREDKDARHKAQEEAAGKETQTGWTAGDPERKAKLDKNPKGYENNR